LRQEKPEIIVAESTLRESPRAPAGPQAPPKAGCRPNRSSRNDNHQLGTSFQRSPPDFRTKCASRTQPTRQEGRTERLPAICPRTRDQSGIRYRHMTKTQADIPRIAAAYPRPDRRQGRAQARRFAGKEPWHRPPSLG
jgi:hypothetical protein